MSDNSEFASILKEYLTDPEVVFLDYHPKPEDVVWLGIHSIIRL